MIQFHCHNCGAKFTLKRGKRMTMQEVDDWLDKARCPKCGIKIVGNTVVDPKVLKQIRKWLDKKQKEEWKKEYQREYMREYMKGYRIKWLNTIRLKHRLYMRRWREKRKKES